MKDDDFWTIRWLDEPYEEYTLEDINNMTKPEPKTYDVTFTEDDFTSVYYAVREAQILWRKRRMFAQGKIQLNEDPNSPAMFSVLECNEKIQEYKDLEEKIYWLGRGLF